MRFVAKEKPVIEVFKFTSDQNDWPEWFKAAVLDGTVSISKDRYLGFEIILAAERGEELKPRFGVYIPSLKVSAENDDWIGRDQFGHWLILDDSDLERRYSPVGEPNA